MDQVLRYGFSSNSKINLQRVGGCFIKYLKFDLCIFKMSMVTMHTHNVMGLGLVPV